MCWNNLAKQYEVNIVNAERAVKELKKQEVGGRYYYTIGEPDIEKLEITELKFIKG